MVLTRRRARTAVRSAIDQAVAYAQLILWLSLVSSAVSAPGPETLLPTNTVAAIATPDFPALRQATARAPLVRFWNDPAMAVFTARARQGWSQGFPGILIEMAGASGTNLLNFCQGQAALGLTAGGSPGTPGGMVLIADSGSRAGDLGTFLGGLQGSWTNLGYSVRNEDVAAHKFLALSFPRQTVPQALRDFFPQAGSATTATTNTGPLTEILAGKVNSWLVLGTRKPDLEQVCTALSSNRSTASFARQYGTNHPVILPQAVLYSWVEASSLLGVVARNYPLPTTGAAGAAEDITPDTLIKATGVEKVRTLFFSARETANGLLYQMTWTVPERDRHGLVRLLAAESKPCTPLPFLPEEAVEYDRWRVDGRKAWDTLQQIFTGISPHWTNSAALILDTANAAARLKDATFDIRTNLFGNLGDDIIIVEKPPRDFTPAALDSPPTLYLLGSPNPVQLAEALSSIFIFFDREAERPTTRVFAGQTIRSVPLPPLPLSASPPAAMTPPRRLHYAPAQGYVALSTDVAFLEQFLQATNSPASSLAAQADFATAVQQVVEPGTGLFGCNHRLNLVRSLWPTAQTSTNTPAKSLVGFDYGFLPGLLSSMLPSNSADWFDVKLLPPANSVEKYFHYTVYGGAASSNGITWKMFEPTPPGLK